MRARVPMRVSSEKGRTEFVLVGLVHTAEGGGFAAYPIGKGSGSVVAFARADGFVTVPRHQEYIDVGEEVAVTLIDPTARPADLVVIGSHCSGLDYLLGELHAAGVRVKALQVGSTGGLEAAKRGECDIAAVHLLDPETDAYNSPFLTPTIDLIPGYGRLQGVVFRRGDDRFAGRPAVDAVRLAAADPRCVMVNRNRGSGTRVLIDRLLKGLRPPGYFVEANSHHASAAAVAQGRADWGVAIAPVARAAGLGFLPLQEERFDFMVPRARRQRPAVRAFEELLRKPEIRGGLRDRGFRVD